MTPSDINSPLTQTSVSAIAARTATVTATSDIQMLGLTEWVFRGLMQEHPSIAVKTLQQMAARLRNATKAATA